MNPFDKSFKAQYELALKEGNRRFGSECKHENVYSGRCCNCLRRVVTKKKFTVKRKRYHNDLYPNPTTHSQR